MPDDVQAILESGVLAITIHRPGSGNALNQAVLGGLQESFRRAGEDRAVRVVTITGAGDRVFCAGADLKAALGSASAPFRPGDYRELLWEILQCPKPTVALARGHVMAGGLGLLLACDLGFACDDIWVSTPEINVGMFPMMVLALLCRHVGRKRAAEMAMLGERIPARVAREYAILNQTFPRAEFESETARRIRSLADKSSRILRLGKEAFQRIEGRSLREDLEFLEQALEAVMSSADSAEGIRAFVEKRTPKWRDE